MDNDDFKQLQLNENMNDQYKSSISHSSHSIIDIPKPPKNNEREQAYSWSFNSHFMKNNISQTPVCSDNDEPDTENDDDDDDYDNNEYTQNPSTTPGAKRWYMSFPDDTDNNNNNNNNKNNNNMNKNNNMSSLSSFELGMAMDFCYENLQHQETDIFSSKNLSNDDDGNKPITMMGYATNNKSSNSLHSSFGLRLNDNLYIPGQFQTNLYSEGNINYNSDHNVMDNDEGDPFTEITYIPSYHNDDNNNNHLDVDGDDDDDDDDMFVNNNNNITLMGDNYDINLNENNKENVGVTLMGYFDDNNNDKNDISFNIKQK